MNGVDPLHDRCLAVIDEAAQADREKIISQVQAQFDAEGRLDPNFAVQKWIELIAQDRLKAAVRSHGRTEQRRQRKG